MKKKRQIKKRILYYLDLFWYSDFRIFYLWQTPKERELLEYREELRRYWKEEEEKLEEQRLAEKKEKFNELVSEAKSLLLGVFLYIIIFILILLT